LIHIITNKDIEKGCELIQFFFNLMKEFPCVSLILNNTINKSSHSQQNISNKMIEEIENIITLLNQKLSSFSFIQFDFQAKKLKLLNFSE
jgi:hypothetical protein